MRGIGSKMSTRGQLGLSSGAEANGEVEHRASVSVAKPLENLILPADEIFDAAAVSEIIANAVAKAGGGADIRKAAVDELTQRRDAGMKAISEKTLVECKVNPFASLKAVRSYAYLTDGIMTTVLNLATGPLVPETGTAEPISVAAVGGYGRGEMAPQSDVDLLFLNSGKI